MTDNPAYVARNLDDLPKILAEIFSQCAEGGMVFPFIACAISPNGNVCVFRVEPAGNEILAEHYENQPFRLPMTITVVDQKNEVRIISSPQRELAHRPWRRQDDRARQIGPWQVSIRIQPQRTLTCESAR